MADLTPARRDHYRRGVRRRDPPVAPDAPPTGRRYPGRLVTRPRDHHPLVRRDGRASHQAVVHVRRLPRARRRRHSGEWRPPVPGGAAALSGVRGGRRGLLRHDRVAAVMRGGRSLASLARRNLERKTAELLGCLAGLEWVAGVLGALVPVGRPITLMFTDIEGFTGYAAARGDGAAVELLRRHDDAVLPAIRRHRGRLVKRLGDGLMIAFPSPTEAVKTALVMQAGAARARVKLRSGRAMARSGLRMMPTAPSPSLKFRTAGVSPGGLQAR